MRDGVEVEYVVDISLTFRQGNGGVGKEDAREEQKQDASMSRKYVHMKKPTGRSHVHGFNDPGFQNPTSSTLFGCL